MTSELSKTFDPSSIEQRWYNHWEDNGLFRPERPDAQPFTIVNPPPNVTGSLHIGHALDNTLQDIVIRYERLRGKDALWVVGIDHAGIATQMVVERQMEEKQDKRTNYSREEFVQKVWDWKAESGGTITGQLRRLGCSMDWSREQFTMDEHFSKAVLKTFVDFYNDGLIYRDKRLVNWDPKLKTAISDLEVETQDIKGQFWHFKYPLADGVTLADGRDYIEVATTRPETMLADMAVAVHPTDERYASVVGKEVVLPITGRRVKIVEDEHADPELGSGAVKITPGHDFNDFEVGKRAGIAAGDMLNMLDSEANVCQTADGLVPDEYLGLHRFKRDGTDGARELVVKQLKELGLLIPHITKTKKGEELELDSEPRTIATPFGDRGGVVIEPWLTDQWYVDAEKLAARPMEAVRNGDIEIIPQSWEKTFFHWMENIQPWCISRQLWWGHRIPAWFGPKVSGDKISYDFSGQIGCETFVGIDEQDVSLQAEKIYSKVGFNQVAVFDSYEDLITSGILAKGHEKTVALWRDEDVLDTWFSSGLWPFATLGWPDENAPLYQKHYPNDLLISGFDILFFWDARMAMQGMKLTDQAPWKRLYLHGLVRAADGSKMSKSKGNVVDPLGLIDQYGADALRFFMAAMESQGRDIKMDDERVKGYRNFATKLWNATRFCQSNGIGGSTTLEAPAATSAVNRWIIGEVAETLAKLDAAMADLRFDAAANIIYHFTWDTFCDWYIELVKGNFDDETKAVAGWVLDQILVMLHPFMPFVTEELWNAQADRANYPLITAKWPEFSASVDADAKAEVEWLIGLTSAVRGAKNELGVPPGQKLEAYCPAPSALAADAIARNSAAIERLARITTIHTSEAPDGAAMQIGAGSDTLIIPLEGLVDIDAEKARLNKALEASAKEAKSLEGRLSNANFVERAKPDAVEKAKADFAHHSAEVERITAALARLG
ncbi:valine--tRNA ligase [Altererythrobacter sp. RZ02]|uniref:Valine--tRNA ligase n=1 Tax=Pontixanthobacter rizhaonensis TaxID=2730337 RepID=A0A848QE56_9SPHN|nr:valine--tRNA ligase [Pontixanthobacter rizhaonensis]NMW30712.1 valine--tRNA ligase [Pontixanthobacter rizhaonensis]